MSYEIDFLPVGDGERCGDAITLRFGNLYGSRDEQVVVVIDGGYRDNGEAVVQHIKMYYETDRVDLVISTHADQDHISGLHVVLEELKVDELWMHKPWEYSSAAKRALGNSTGNGVPVHVRMSLDSARALEQLAISNGIRIMAPFAGLTHNSGLLRVLTPSEAFYSELLQEFDRSASLLGRMAAKAKTFVKRITESWENETLEEGGETSAVNESSTVLLLSVDERNLLFTADAGQRALDHVVDLFDAAGLDADILDFVQVPHHGSRRSVSPSLLDRLLGPRLSESEKGAVRRRAYVSAAEDAPKHPSKQVTNAFLRRGAPVYSTEGRAIRHHHDAPARDGWTVVNPLPFYNEVEA